MNATPEILLTTLSDTRALAERIAAQLTQGDVIGLSGDLGTGKTTFAQALIETLAHGTNVTSPTFAMLQTYPVTLRSSEAVTLYHYDLYRITHAEELEELGLREATAGVVLIEWPERLSDPSILTQILRFTLDKDSTRKVRLHKMSS